MSSPKDHELYSQQIIDGTKEPSIKVVESAITESPVIALNAQFDRQVINNNPISFDEDALGLFRWIVSDTKNEMPMGCMLLDSAIAFYDEIGDDND